MNELSKETIEIDGVEYTLFLNRVGLVAIEKYTREELNNAKKLEKIEEDIINKGNVEITDDTDPFSGLEGEVADAINNVDTLTSDIYKKSFWIMLNTTHKLTYKDSCDLYDKAIKIYGIEQVNALIDQIVDDVNKNKYQPETNQNVKNLKALRPTK